MSKHALRTAFAAVAGILIAIGGCAENPSAPSDATASFQLIAPPTAPSAFFGRLGTASAVIGPEGGTLQVMAGHKIVFPAGALAEPTTITMRTDFLTLGVELQPHGLVFPEGSEPQLTLDVTGIRLSAFRSVAIGYIGDSGQILEVLPTDVLGASGKLQARLEHFSKYSSIGS
jgi:hypothetical protein